MISAAGRWYTSATGEVVHSLIPPYSWSASKTTLHSANCLSKKNCRKTWLVNHGGRLMHSTGGFRKEVKPAWKKPHGQPPHEWICGATSQEPTACEFLPRCWHGSPRASQIPCSHKSSRYPHKKEMSKKEIQAIYPIYVSFSLKFMLPNICAPKNMTTPLAAKRCSGPGHCPLSRHSAAARCSRVHWAPPTVMRWTEGKREGGFITSVFVGQIRAPLAIALWPCES